MTVMRDEGRRQCTAEGCTKVSKARGYCDVHYARLRSNGTLDAKPIRKRGTGGIDSSGYVVHQRIVDGKRLRIKEHRAVMEQVLGRALLPTETVHHKNGNRADNRPENLEVWVSRHPKGARVQDRVDDAVDLLRTYAPHLLAEVAA